MSDPVARLTEAAKRMRRDATAHRVNNPDEAYYHELAALACEEAAAARAATADLFANEPRIAYQRATAALDAALTDTTEAPRG